MTTTPPHWLSDFSDRVLDLVTPYDRMPSAGCHFQLVEGIWEITLFVGVTETVGGERDGARFESPFSVDLIGIPGCFGELHQMWWQSRRLGTDDQLGSHLSAEGTVGGERVWLRITADAPEQFGPARQVYAHDQHAVDLW